MFFTNAKMCISQKFPHAKLTKGIVNGFKGGSEAYIQANKDVATQKAGGMQASADALRTSKMLDDKERASIERDLIKSKALKSQPSYTNGKVDRDSLDMGTQDEVIGAIGWGMGNKMTDSLKSAVFGGTEFKNAGDSTNATKNTSSTQTSVHFKETGYKKNTNVKGEFATAAAKTIATNPNDSAEVDKLRDSLLAITDAGAFISSEEGTIMGITTAGLALSKKILPKENYDKLLENISPANGEQNGLGVGTYALAGSLGVAGLVGVNKLSKPFMPREKVTAKDILSDGGKYNEDGGLVDKNGNEVNLNETSQVLNSNGEVRTREAKSGVVAKGLGGVWSGLTDGFSNVTDKLRGISSEAQNNPVDSTTDSGEKDKDTKEHKPVDKHSGQHSELLNNSDENIVPEKGVQSNSPKAQLAHAQDGIKKTMTTPLAEHC
ncbi:hypothetical protein KJ877_08390 [bacterium]|nr:hypothetical protein [bacterium]MBU1990234.1 hypothetical protein [bacterium]